MESSKSLVTLYRIIKNEIGTLEAKRALTSAIYNVVSEIQEEGKEVTEYELETRLESYVNDFVQTSKKSDVA